MNMKQFIDILKKLSILFLILIVCYTLVLVVAFAIPTSLIKENAFDVRYFAEINGDGSWLPTPLNEANGVLDLFTDGEMFRLTYEDLGDNFIQSAMVPSYARYWHGYMAFIRPLLIFFSYTEIRQLLPIVFFGLICYMSMLFYKKFNGIVSLVLVSCLTMANITAIPQVFQFADVFIITFMFMLYVMYIIDKDNYEYKLIFGFFILGSVVNFIDLLTVPVVSLGLALTIWLMKATESDEDHIIPNTLKMLGYSVIWSLGYAFTWLAKWLIGSVILRQNVVSEAIESILLRTTGEVEGQTYTKLDMYLKNIDLFTQRKMPEIILLAIILVSLVLVIKRAIRLKSSMVILKHIPFAILAIYPLVWYFVLANHSYVHSWFTYRLLLVSAFSLGCGLLVTAQKEIKFLGDKKWKE